MEINKPQESGLGRPLPEIQPSDITRQNRRGLAERQAEVEETKEAARREAQAADEARVERTDSAFEAARERISAERESRSAEDGTRTDRVDVSKRARLLSQAQAWEGARSEDAHSTERSARIEELKSAHDSGRLNTPERVDRAAAKMLGAT
jgi:hypothetical protein